MKVFISWSGSGSPSHQIARLLHDWLPNILQNVEPFLSNEDIDKGARWLSAVTDELEDCNFGLICLTPDSLTAPWILFEAGALSKFVGRSRVAPILFKLEPSDVQGPLTQFQMVNFGQEEMYGLLQSINNAGGERKLDENRLKNIFAKFWPELDANIGTVQFIPHEERHTIPTRSEDGIKPILEEILVLVRQR